MQTGFVRNVPFLVSELTYEVAIFANGILRIIITQKPTHAA